MNDSGVAPKPVRALFLNSCINGGGAGRSLASLLSVADPRIEALVVMPAPGVLAARLEGAAQLEFVAEFVERMKRSPWSWPDRMGMPWMHVPANVFGLGRCVARLAGLVREWQPDVIHCNHMLAKPIGAAVGVLTGVPVVFHSRACHQLWIDGAFYGWLGRRACVRRIICNSEASATVYRHRSNDKVTVIPNGIDVAAFSRHAVEPVLRRDFDIGAEEFVVGFVGRIQETKGIGWLLRAFALFAAGRTGIRLAIVGGNDSSLHRDALACYRRDAAALGLADQVIFTGFREDVARCMVDFDVLVMPSVVPESFGRVLLEGMALDVPVITAAHGGAVEVVRDGREGLWVGVNDTEGLARAMERLHGDQALCRRLGQNGRRRAVARYDHTLVAHRIYDVLVDAALASGFAAGQESAQRPDSLIQ